MRLLNIWVFLALVVVSKAQQQTACANLTGACATLGPACNEQYHALNLLYTYLGGTNWNSEQPDAPYNSTWKNGTCTLTLSDTSVVNAPSYCCWYGVSCCTTTRAVLGGCNQPCSVTNITLRWNNLNGQFPSTFFEAIGFQLRVFDVQSNFINGTIPESINSSSSLQILNFGYNYLNGSIPLTITQLSNLQELDLARNSLSGTVPADLCEASSGISATLSDLYLHNNNLTGSVNLSNCVNLIALDLQFNSITGSIPTPVEGYNLLHIIRMKSNLISGSIDPNTLWRYRHVTNFDFRINHLTGTIPATINELWYLYRLDLSNNSLTGSIPPELFDLGNLNTVFLANNTLNGTIPPGIGSALSLTDLDLSYNELTGTIPEEMSSLLALTRVDFRNNNLSCCYRPGIGFQAPVPPNGYLPSFLRFANYSAPPVTAPPNPGDTNAGAVPGANMMCMVVVSGNETETSYTTFWLIDPSYYQFQNCTCLQGFDEEWRNVSGNNVLYCKESNSIWNEMPWLIAIIASCCWLVVMCCLYAMCYRRGSKPMIWQTVINVKKRVKGHPTRGEVTVVYTDIEGYEDLLKRLPVPMTKGLTVHNNVIRSAKWASFGYTVEQEEDVYSLVFYEPMDAAQFCLHVQQALVRVEWPDGLSGDGALDTSNKKPKSMFSIAGAVREAGNWLNHTVTGTVESVTTGFRPRPSGTFDPHTAPVDSPAPSVSLATAENKSSLFKLHLAKGKGSAGNQLFNGLRVRMGIATGQLEPGELIKNSSVAAAARVVGQTANGGQILMDSVTFERVKERLQELGAVDHNGMNYRKLGQQKGSWWKRWSRSQRKVQDEAVVLDMGEYISRAGEEVKSILKLYQVLPPPLVGRAKEFKNKLNIQHGFECIDLPYFSAPGTTAAPLGEPTDRITLPAVTMVFCIVDGGKYYAAKSRPNARIVHRLCSSCIRETLRYVEGGYLCREQDGDLKYMVVFHESEAALRWCLIVQEILMYQDWPEAVLKEPKFRVEYSEDNTLLFRGPRLKMGICEGPPKTIIPDHLGRADYHGETINQSARYMDAGAHGGQVVCEMGLAQKVFALWDRGGSPTSQPSASTAGGKPLPSVKSARQVTSTTLAGVTELAEDSLTAGSNTLEAAALEAAAQVASTPASMTQTVHIQTEQSKTEQSKSFGQQPETIGSQDDKDSVHSSAAPVSTVYSTKAGQEGRLLSGEISPATGGIDSSASGATIAIFGEPPIFGAKQAGQESEASPYMNPSADSLVRCGVEAYRTGIFRFKGNPEDIEMVYVTLSQLAGRSFPSEPPKGKGNRIAAASGKALSTSGIFPEAVCKLRAKFICTVPSQRVKQALLYAGDPPPGQSQKALHTLSGNRRKWMDLSFRAKRSPTLDRAQVTQSMSVRGPVSYCSSMPAITLDMNSVQLAVADVESQVLSPANKGTSSG